MTMASPPPRGQLPDYCNGPEAFGYFPGLCIAKTNHILHLLLTVFTFGFWAPMWLLLALMNAHTTRVNIERYNQWVAQVRGDLPPSAPPAQGQLPRLV